MKTRTTLLLTVLTTLVAPLALVEAKPKSAKAKERTPPPAAEEQSRGVVHIVKRGETLGSIAKKYYGSNYEWVRLKQDNPFVDDPDRLNIGERITVLDPQFIPDESEDTTSSANPSGTGPLGWIPDLSGITLFGKSIPQILLLLMAWFFVHFTIQGFLVWFAAHLTFVKDVSLKKAMRATLQAESLALVCFLMIGFVGLMLVYVGTTSPGNPLSSDLFSTAEQYLRSPGGLMAGGLLTALLYGFLGIRFIPQAFGIQTGRGATLVLVSILLPHLAGMFLLNHRLGLLN